ncbi:MAG: MBL fold metallo-hydrolase [Actinomycetota bacterium]|nr:MBL fold metallo-hydrolase [Actinomycetota bacterium]
MANFPVRRIEMPTPYAVGPVNAYLIDASPLTLIDAGINTSEARDALTSELDAAGTDLASIERVLITHAHPDHYGLVHLIQELSDATVHMPEREIARITDRTTMFEVGRLLLEAGMPMHLLMEMDEARRAGPRSKMDHGRVVPVQHGDRFAFEGAEGSFELEAHLMPGHTGGHVVYLEPERRTLFAGDQLLGDVSPNPLLEASLDAPGERRRSLEEYLKSLEEMSAMDLALVYPGHGPPITDPGSLIRSTVEGHAKRKIEVAGHLAATGKTPYEIALEMWPDASGPDSFLTVSEVVAHLDLVVDDGDAVVERRSGMTYYSAPPA